MIPINYTIAAFPFRGPENAGLFDRECQGGEGEDHQVNPQHLRGLGPEGGEVVVEEGEEGGEGKNPTELIDSWDPVRVQSGKGGKGREPPVIRGVRKREGEF